MRTIFSSRESVWLALTVLLSGCVALAPIACSQIIGADKDRVLANEASASKTPPPASVDAGTVAQCDADQKRCSGACVAIDDPQYGCGPTDCTPCDVPYAASEKCVSGVCEVATCTPGRDDCNGLGTDGCEADLGAAATCGNCTTACGGAVGPYCTPKGTCVSDCTGYTLCGTSCRTLTDNADNCGTCGNVCKGAAQDAARVNSVGACNGGTCGISCNLNYGDCDANQNDGCEEKLSEYYPDLDGDGYGATGSMSAGSACANAIPTKNATNASDCLDTNAQVHPNQPTTYFTSSYTTLGGTPSFDYNCDNKETASSTFTLGGTCTPCANGYTPVSGAKYANVYCGSTQETSCILGTSPSCSTSGGHSAVGCN
jgi:hypothetical protein